MANVAWVQEKPVLEGRVLATGVGCLVLGAAGVAALIWLLHWWSMRPGELVTMLGMLCMVRA